MKTYATIITACIWFLSLIGAMGCSTAGREEEPEQPDKVEPGFESGLGFVTLSFNMMPMLSEGVSNPDNHPEEPGTGDELNIYDKTWLHVYIHDCETGELKLHFTNQQSSPLYHILIEPSGNGTYRVLITTLMLQPGKDYRLSVMANCQDNSGNLYGAASQFQNTPENSSFLQKPHFMPFAGFKRWHLPENTVNQEVINIGSLWLLRAVARIDVLLADDMKTKWNVEKAVIKDAGYTLYSTAYASPAEVNVAKFDSTEKMTMDAMFNPRRTALMSNPGGADIAMRDINGNGSSFRIYLPEQENPVPTSENEMAIELTMRHKLSDQVVTAILYLRDYPSDTPINLVRNHIYRFNIKSVKPLFDVDVDILKPANMVINVPSFN